MIAKSKSAQSVTSSAGRLRPVASASATVSEAMSSTYDSPAANRLIRSVETSKPTTSP